MPSLYLTRELTIIAIGKALEPLWPELLPMRVARDACYVRCDIDPADADRHDAEALRRAVIYRGLLENRKKKEAA